MDLLTSFSEVSRPYHQFCGVAKALDRVGDRWTLLIVRDLLLGPRRFGELEAALAGVPPALLTARLRELEGHGLVERPSRGLYALTPLGRELEPVILALGRFGARWLTRPGDEDRVDLRWAMLSLMRRFSRAERDWTLVARTDDRAWTLRFGPDGLRTQDGADDADAEVTGSEQAWFGLLSGRVEPKLLLESGALAVTGDVDALTALVGGLN